MSEQLAATRRGFAFMLWAMALLGLASGCGSKNIVLATIQGDAAVSDAAVGDAALGDAGLHQPCNRPSECRPGTVCSKTGCDAGTCEEAGSCQNFGPVCGCNMVTYVNDCERLKAGDGPMFPFPCGFIDAGTMGQCDLRTNAGCSNGTKCAGLYTVPLLPRDVCNNVPATCWAIPESCPDQTGQAVQTGPSKWDPCGPGESCVDTCTAIRTGGAYRIAACEFQRSP